MINIDECFNNMQYFVMNYIRVGMGKKEKFDASKRLLLEAFWSIDFFSHFHQCHFIIIFCMQWKLSMFITKKKFRFFFFLYYCSWWSIWARDQKNTFAKDNSILFQNCDAYYGPEGIKHFRYNVQGIILQCNKSTTPGIRRLFRGQI